MRLPTIPRTAIGPILLGSLLVLLIFYYKPPARPSIAPPWAVPGWFPFEWSPMSGEPRPTPASVAGHAIQRAQLDVTSSEGLYNEEEQRLLANEVERALAYVVDRFGHEPTSDIQVSVGQNAGCNLSGIAYTDRRIVQVITCADMPRQRAVNILAHEFVHQLAHDYYGDQHLQADMMLAEGLATFGAGSYWLGGKPDFRTFVGQTYGETLLPLATSYVGRPISDMNQLYYQWAAFVEYLIGEYGREQFDAVYVSGSKSPGSADYAGIYGKDLPTLEQEWQAWLGSIASQDISTN